MIRFHSDPFHLFFPEDYPVDHGDYDSEYVEIEWKLGRELVLLISE